MYFIVAENVRVEDYRAVHSAGAEGAAAPARKTQFSFSDIVFKFAELFLVAMLLRNHTKID